MAMRVQFENNDDIGVFSKLTNSYCIVAIGGAETFYRFVHFIKGYVLCFVRFRRTTALHLSHTRVVKFSSFLVY